MGKETYICPCYKVTKEDIKAAIKDGADSFKKVKKITNISEKCGHCECRVKKYVKKKLKQNSCKE